MAENTFRNFITNLPHNCLFCEDKIKGIRDLVKLDCQCNDSYYHFLCLPSTMSHYSCPYCNDSAPSLRGTRALWNEVSHDGWKQIIEAHDALSFEVLLSLVLDWKRDLPRSLSLKYLIMNFWSIPRSLIMQPRKDLIYCRLQENKQIWPLYNRVLIAPPKVLKFRSLPVNHDDFLSKVWFWSCGVVTPEVFDSKNLFISGSAIYDILCDPSDVSGTLVFIVLAFDLINLRKILKDLFEILSHSISSEKRELFVLPLGPTKIQVAVRGIARTFEIVIYNTNDIRKVLLLNTNHSSWPYRTGLAANKETLLVTMKWLSMVLERTVIARSARPEDLSSINFTPVEKGYFLSLQLEKTYHNKHYINGYPVVTIDNLETILLGDNKLSDLTQVEQVKTAHKTVTLTFPSWEQPDTEMSKYGLLYKLENIDTILQKINLKDKKAQVEKIADPYAAHH